MSKSIDVDAVKNSVQIQDVIAGYIQLTPNGNEFTACCPFHEEKTPSFNVVPDKDFYHCFGCGAHGDAIDFIAEYTGVGFKDACKAITGGQVVTTTSPEVRKSVKVNYYERYTPNTLPPDSDVPAPNKPFSVINPKRDHKKTSYTPSMVFPYRDRDGGLIGFVCRMEVGDGKKITPTIRWCGVKYGWVTHPFDDMGRSLYRIDKLSDGKQIIIVEGEKAADALASVEGDKLCVMTWAGGTNAVRKTDWNVLQGHSVIIIPDNDGPGFKAADEIRQILNEVGATSIKTVIPEPTRPKGWDVADQEWTSTEHFISWAKSRVGKLEDDDSAPQQEESEVIESYLDDAFGPPSDDEEVFESNTPVVTADSNDEPFKLLGYNNDEFFFLPRSSQQIKVMTASNMSGKANLLTMAPLEHWVAKAGLAPGDKLKTEHWDMHVNGIIQTSYKQGIFNSGRIRGRGAWIDDGRKLLHVGETIYVDGQPTEPENVQSKFLYPRALDMHVKYTTAATNKQANQLVKLCGELSWEKDLSGALLAGWCVIAPLCGMIKWRPHIWVTGPSGSGKSTVLNDIIQMMVGEVGVKVEGKTTEAGIRQMLGNDARPILFDEAEAEDESSAKRMQSILDFARVSSSGGKILKGSAAGSSVEFIARSAFCFSSINTSIKEMADEARITKLVLRQDKTKPQDFWEKLEIRISNTITPEYAGQMLSRSIQNMDVIRKNIDVFIHAAHRHFKSRRIADQIGTMLAGTYLCYSTSLITEEKARDWIKRHDWQDHTTSNDYTDGERLLARICSHRIRVQTDDGAFDVTMGEAIDVAIGKPSSEFYKHQDHFESEIKRHGIRVINEGGKYMVAIANKSDAMKSVLTGSPWASSWDRALMEIEGSEKLGRAIRFTPAIVSRATLLPISIFGGE